MGALLELELYTKDFELVGWLNDYEDARLILRHNRRSVAEFSYPASGLCAADLITPGARIVAWYTPVGGSRRQVLSGRATITPSGPSLSSTLRVAVDGDWAVLDILGWPVPDGTVFDQGSAEAWSMRDDAETVVKALIAANTDRLSLPVTVVATAGRGDTVTANVRMVRLSDIVGQLADTGGIGVSVAQSGAGIRIDAYVGTDRTTIPLSEAGGTVEVGEVSLTPPKATRVVVGGAGEGTARIWARIVMTTRETQWGIIAEEFVDAGGESDSVKLQDLGQAALAEGAGGITFSATVTESEVVRYGVSLELGDTFAVEVLPGVITTDIVREVQITSTTSDGLVVTPVIGDPDTTQPERATAAAIGRLRHAVRTLRAR